MALELWKFYHCWVERKSLTLILGLLASPEYAPLTCRVGARA